MRFDVIPLVGVGPVLLGMRREEVRAAMRAPPKEFRKSSGSVHTTDAFHSSAFQVFYSGVVPVVEFIELSRGSEIEAVFNGIELFTTPADELVSKISLRTAFDPSDPELGYSYVFPELQLAFWRPHVPDDDELDGHFFSTVGIGVPGYFTVRAG